MEDDAGSGDSDDFLEDAADAEGDDRGALQEGELRRGHAEGEDTREEKEENADYFAFCFGEEVEAEAEVGEAFDRDGEE